MRLRTLGVVLLAVAAAGVYDAAQSRPWTGYFTLAVVRRDGVMIPFATWNGSRWQNSWPEPGKTSEFPLGLRDVPSAWWGPPGLISAWTFYPVTGERRMIRPLAPTQVVTHCESNIGLRTDYVAPVMAPPVLVHHQPKDGLATTTDLPIEVPTVLTDADPDWAAVAGWLPGPVTRAEEKAILRSRTLALELSAIVRDKQPVTLEVLCRSAGRTGVGSVHYFEVSKRYRTRVACGSVTFVRGWIRTNPNQRTAVSLDVTVTDCDMREAVYFTPLGVLRIGDAPLWVVQAAGFGFEEYVIVDPGVETATTVFSTRGGGC